MPAIFVTGTGTDVGKTFVTAGLIRHLRGAGQPVDALKPVVSGFDPAQPQTSDPGVLLGALGRPTTPAEIERISPWRFSAPQSPDMAARKESRAVDFAALIDLCRRSASNQPGVLFIEGVGGAMVPLDASHTVLDWMAALDFPLLVVTGSYLGSISHTLTCLEVLGARGLVVRALVVSETQDSTVPLPDTIDTLSRFAAVPIVALPRLPAGTADHPAFAQIAALTA
jgi:dethiobiotin synthetase